MRRLVGFAQRAAMRAIIPLLSLFLLPVTPAAAHGIHDRPHMLRPAHGMQISVGPIAVPQSKEVTDCTYFKLGIDHDLAVNRVKIKVRGGSHHQHIYRSTDPTRDVPDGVEVCNMAVDFDEWELVLASQSVLLDWKLPRGVAFYFRAHEQLLVQSHFVDNGLLAEPTERVGTLQSLRHPGADGRVLRRPRSSGRTATCWFPPHSTTSATTRCVFPKPVNLIGRPATTTSAACTSPPACGTGRPPASEVYHHEGYLEPLFKRYGEGELSNVPGIEWTCTWDNPNDVDYKFGPFTDQNEHCNLFAFYYPSIGKTEAMTCVQENREVTVTVRH